MTGTTEESQGNFLARLVRRQIFIPLAALLLLIVFNLIADPSFFAITLKENSLGDLVLTGNLITILDNASELVILAIGMTLVTAASGGQDISVGSAIAIAGSVVLRVLCGTNSRPDTLQAPIIAAFLVCCVVSMLFGAFNGTLVAVFKIQPMVATLILYTAGRSIAAWINNNELPMISDPAFAYYGNFLPGVAVPTPIFIAVICMVLAWALLRFTNIGLYSQAVGINASAARLNGIHPQFVKFLTYVILGLCVAVAGFFYTAAIRIKATKNWAARNFLTAQLSAEKRLHSFLMAADAIYGIAFKCFLNTLVLLPQLYTVPSSAGPQMRGRYGNLCGTRSGAEPRSRAVKARAV